MGATIGGRVRTELSPFINVHSPMFCKLSRPDRLCLHCDIFGGFLILAESGFIPANVSIDAYGKCIGTVTPLRIYNNRYIYHVHI